MEDAIRLARTFDDPDPAVRFLAASCVAGEQWAVVDLSTMGVVGTGSTPRPSSRSQMPRDHRAWASPRRSEGPKSRSNYSSSTK
jgi:hypothetical protein